MRAVGAGASAVWCSGGSRFGRAGGHDRPHGAAGPHLLRQVEGRGPCRLQYPISHNIGSGGVPGGHAGACHAAVLHLWCQRGREALLVLKCHLSRLAWAARYETWTPKLVCPCYKVPAVHIVMGISIRSIADSHMPFLEPRRAHQRLRPCSHHCSHWPAVLAAELPALQCGGRRRLCAVRRGGLRLLPAQRRAQPQPGAGAGARLPRALAGAEAEGAR